MTTQSHDAETTRPAALGRTRRALVLRGVTIGACALLAAACGSTVAPGTASSGSGSATAQPASAAKVSLVVRFTGSATTKPAQYTLRCEPASGTVSNPAAACTKLLSGANIFAPKPTHVMCPMILADAGRAYVTGTYLGAKVHETIVDGGCDLGRWAKLRQVFN